MTTQVHAKHILVDTEEEANEILERLKQGEKFEALAKMKSKCPSKMQGGDLGWFGKGTMVQEFEQKSFSLNKGETGKVKTQFGWHVIRVEETK